MRIVSVSLLISTIVAAQGVTSPKGYNAIEGNMVFAHFGGARRFQQLDYTQSGTPLVINKISWRRNGGSAGTAGTRTFDFVVDLGRCDFGAISHILDANFIAGTRTTVYNVPATLFPDWSASLPGPAPFDFTIMLAAPHVYVGTDALAIDFSYTNSSAAGTLSVDREFVGATTPPAGTLLGVGCVATGNVGAFSHTAYGQNLDVLPTPAYGMRLRLAGTNAPPGSTSVLAFLDVTNQNLSGIVCSTIYSLGLVTIPLTAIAGNTVPDVSFGFPHNAAAAGATIYTQLVALDVGQSPIPVVVSNGRAVTIPAAPAIGGHRCSYGWTTLPTATAVATHFIGGGMVMLLQ